MTIWKDREVSIEILLSGNLVLFVCKQTFKAHLYLGKNHAKLEALEEQKNVMHF